MARLRATGQVISGLLHSLGGVPKTRQAVSPHRRFGHAPPAFVRVPLASVPRPDSAQPPVVTNARPRPNSPYPGTSAIAPIPPVMARCPGISAAFRAVSTRVRLGNLGRRTNPPIASSSTDLSDPRPTPVQSSARTAPSRPHQADVVPKGACPSCAACERKSSSRQWSRQSDGSVPVARTNALPELPVDARRRRCPP